MGRKMSLSVVDRYEAVLSLLRREEPATKIARRYGISEQSLYRLRDQFLEGGKGGLAGKAGGSQGERGRLQELEKEIAERDRVIGELTIANRILKKGAAGLY